MLWNWAGIELCNPFDKSRAASQGIVDRLSGPYHLRHVEGEILLAVKECYDLIGRPCNGATIRWMMEPSSISQCVPNRSWEFLVGPIEKDEREFEVEQRPSRMHEIGLQQVAVREFQQTPAASVIHHPESDEKHDMPRP